MSGPGHNSNAQLLAFVDRLMNLQDVKAEAEEDIRELKAEAKGVNVDPKRVAALAKLKRQGREDAKARLDEFETNLHTLGWLD